MKKVRICQYVVFLLMALLLASCTEKQQVTQKKFEADSVLIAAYNERDYDRLLFWADTLQSSGMISKMRACYWRGYAYSRQRMMRSAEMAWKEAVSLEVENGEDLEYYAKSANRLAGLLYLKSDYETTIRVAMTAMELMKTKDYDMNTDYANLQIFIGSCQLKLGRPQEAAESFDLGYQHFLQIIGTDNDINDFTSTIVGIITITDAYLLTDYYREAYDWTDRFDNMLMRYKQHPQANESYVDKQWARLNLYRACSLEGMGKKVEAEKAYREALTTEYAQTYDGRVEAANYLISAERWSEAADKLEVLDAQLKRYDMRLTLDNIQNYLLPKFRANLGAGRKDSALAASTWICNALDSAINWQKHDNAVELATIYDTQQKETQIAEQKATLSRQRFASTVIAFVLVIIGFVLITFLRHRSAKRLMKAYAELEVANARAEESSRMKTDFIKQISHEIRTPLNILSGFTQIITTPGMKLDDDTSKDINQQIIENTNRITSLVNKMLELSDVSSLAVIECKDTVPALQIAAQAAEDSGISVATHITFDISYDGEAESAILTTNLLQATRALSLLLDNAKKFTKQGSVKLIVGKSGNQLHFTVEDTGIGVPRAEAEHIFEEFVQLDSYYEGTGIGLTVARSIARRLGGDVILDCDYGTVSSAESQSGTDGPGARFVLSLPV